MPENQMIASKRSGNSLRGSFIHRRFMNLCVTFSRGNLPLVANCCHPRPRDYDGAAFSEPVYSDDAKVPNRTTHSFAHSSPMPEFSDKAKLETPPIPRSEGDIIFSQHLKAFTFSELQDVTRNFRPDSLLGEGGFGNVYKGWINEKSLKPARPGSGMVVAVKKLKSDTLQGHKEWLSELNYLGQLRHPNLVKLIGYCLDGDSRLLVYEYMPNSSLENHLFCKTAQSLSWATRIKVAIGAARGLAFLHDSKEQVIYRDFKASNILLDSEFNAKLSDFGFAKAGPTGDHTHVSTQVLGTYGYAAPEYIATGWLTAKCDVYSFGVVLLELLSGRRAFDRTKSGVEQNLVDWARPYLGDKRKLFRIMDTKLEGQYPQKAAYIAAILALQCISEAKHRPLMSQVLATLEQLPVSRTSATSSSRSRPDRHSIAGSEVEQTHTKTSPGRHNHHSSGTRSVSSHLNESTVRSALTSPEISPRGQYKKIGYSQDILK